MSETENLEKTEELIEENVAEETQEVEEKRETIKLNKEFEEVDGRQYSKETMRSARENGWRPRDKMEGDKKGNYLPPDEFVRKGKEISAIQRKKIESLENKINQLSKTNKEISGMLGKQLRNATEDRINNLNSEIKKRREEGDLEDVEALIERKLKLQQEQDEYLKSQQDSQKQPPITQEVQFAIRAWETRNPWIFDRTTPVSSAKVEFTNASLTKINIEHPNLTIEQKLNILDNEIRDYDKPQPSHNERSNLVPPIEGSNRQITRTKKRSFENLTQSKKKLFHLYNKDIHERPFKGEALKAFTASFLEKCDDNDFI
jgi:hypothetical protein